MVDQLAVQQEIAKALHVCPPFYDQASLELELRHRITFLKDTLQNSGLTSYVLGISGGVDSLTAGLMAQRAVNELKIETKNSQYRFIAVRLPYREQADESDAMASVDVIAPDQLEIINIASSVQALVDATSSLESLSDSAFDFLVGNIKARVRMVAQYAIAGANQGLVIGTDHAAEAVMGFFTKYGDGACDLTPLAGLVKNQVRAFAAYLGAPDHLVNKIPTADLEDLKPGLPDELAHGVSYNEIDAFLHGQAVSTEAFNKITKTYDQSAHKRRLPLTP